MTHSTRPFPAAEIKKLANELLSLEKQIATNNEAKSIIYKTTQAHYGASVGDGLRSAVGLLRLEPHKRAEKMKAGLYAEDIVKIVLDEAQPSPAPANQNTPRPSLVHPHEARVLEGTLDPIIMAAATGNMAAAINEAMPTAAIDAVSALVNLKYSKAAATQAVTAVIQKYGDQPLKELIRLALKGSNKHAFVIRPPAEPPCSKAITADGETFDPETGELGANIEERVVADETRAAAQCRAN